MFGLFTAATIMFLSYIVLQTSGVSFTKSYATHFAYGAQNVSKADISDESIKMNINKIGVHQDADDGKHDIVEKSDLVVFENTFSQPGKMQPVKTYQIP
jgi:hypothetical protein